MAEKIIVQIDLEKGDVSGASSALEKSGRDAGKKAAVSFSREFDTGISSGLKSLASTAFKVTSAIGAMATAYAGFKAIDAAKVQEDAINKLNNSLKTAGDFSEEASKSMQLFASDLQAVTRFGDETILGQLALAKSFGATNEQAKQIVSAAADLSSAFGMDINSATRNVAKTLGGLAGELGEVIPQIKGLGVEALQSGKAIDIIANRFSGAALRDTKTFSGSVDQLNNSFGDLLESIGRIITNNPQFASLIRQSTKLIETLTKEVDGFAKNFNLFEFISSNLIPFNDAMITYVIAPLELAGNVANIVNLQFQTWIAKTVSGIGNLGFAIAKFLDAFDIGKKLSENLKVFEESSEETAKEIENNLKVAIENVGNFSMSDTFATKNEELRAYLDEQNNIAAENSVVVQEMKRANDEVAQSSLMTWKDAFAQFYESMKSNTDATSNQINKTNDTIKTFVADSSKQLRDGFARGAGQAFAAFGQAVAKGGNALDAFTKVLFKTIADQSIALGTSFILQGSAMLFSPNPADNARAPFLIKAGAALAAFGGFLGATAGGDGASGSGGNTAIGAGNVDLRNPVADPDAEQERTAPSTNVSIQVQGSLVQQEELGEFITRTLNESFGKQGVTLTDARFA